MNKIKEHFFAFLRQMKNIHSNDIFLIEYELRLHFFQQFLYMTIFEVLLTAISYVKIFLNPYALRFHPKNGNLIRIYGETEHLKKVTSDLYELSPCYFAYIKQNYASEKQSVRQEDNSENRFISD